MPVWCDDMYLSIYLADINHHTPNQHTYVKDKSVYLLLKYLPKLIIFT